MIKTNFIDINGNITNDPKKAVKFEDIEFNSKGDIINISMGDIMQK